jgi:hypothetical protein
MGTRKMSAMVKYVGKRVIVKSGKQMCRWVCMEKCYNENVMVKFQS